MVGALMKGFNITFYDDRRLCHMMGCTQSMIAFKWDHAVRDFMDPEKRDHTLCCLPRNISLQQPPVEECTDPQRRHEVGSLSLSVKL
jgi:galactosylxylosylprotein 3-beta-galactosyltransferase